MRYRVALLKQGLFRKDQLNYVERKAKEDGIDLNKMELKELIEICEVYAKRFINKEHSPDDNFDSMLKNSKWKTNKPQETKPL